MRIGQKVKKETATDTARRGRGKEGIVTFIHPRNAWYMVEFKVKGGSYRECYKFTKGEK